VLINTPHKIDCEDGLAFEFTLFLLGVLGWVFILGGCSLGMFLSADIELTTQNNNHRQQNRIKSALINMRMKLHLDKKLRKRTKKYSQTNFQIN